jgi:hypothetical protein
MCDFIFRRERSVNNRNGIDTPKEGKLAEMSNWEHIANCAGFIAQFNENAVSKYEV